MHPYVLVEFVGDDIHRSGFVFYGAVFNRWYGLIQYPIDYALF